MSSPLPLRVSLIIWMVLTKTLLITKLWQINRIIIFCVIFFMFPVHNISIQYRASINLPSKIRSSIFLRLVLQTPRAVIQTFGAKTWLGVFVFFLGFNHRSQWWRHQLGFLENNRRKATRRAWPRGCRGWKLPAKNGGRRSRSSRVGSPQTRGYP